MQVAQCSSSSNSCQVAQDCSLSHVESTSQLISYRVRLRLKHILKDVAQLAYERPQFFADVPPPPFFLAKDSSPNLHQPQIASASSASVGHIISSILPSMHPAMNDEPLQFNVDKSKPPMPVQLVSDDDSGDPIIILEDCPSGSRDWDGDRGRKNKVTRNRERGRVWERHKDWNSGSEHPRSRGFNRLHHDSSGNNDMMFQDPMVHSTGMNSGMNGQQDPSFNGSMNSWAPSWGPVPSMGPMGEPIGPESMGPMGEPIIPHRFPVGSIDVMADTVGSTGNDVAPLLGDFRITWGMFGWTMHPRSPEGLMVPVKNPMQLNECLLVPPSALAPLPTMRERPAGCRTVFVGGLPDKVTEEIVRDVFERCGEITTVRLSKFKNFCHIRYELEEYLDNAIFLSGYGMRIENTVETVNTGRLHVDYAQARDDQYEFECRQRQLQREQRHRERVETDMLRPPSPPPMAHFSEHEAFTISELIKSDEGFVSAAQTLISWLERGDCSKRNAGTFYSMIQSANSHVRRLLTEKGQCEEELRRFQEETRSRVHGILAQFSHIERVFSASAHKKVWDHFTKAQRRNIEMWKKQAQEIKQVQLSGDDSYEREEVAEMDLSEDDNDEQPPAGKRRRMDDDYWKEENDSLRCQMEAYKNEIDMVKSDLVAEVSARDDQIDSLKKSLQTLQQTLAESALRKRGEESRSKGSSEDEVGGNEIEEGGFFGSLNLGGNLLPEKTAWLVGLTSTFLHIHPKGASVDYIWSYIQQFDRDIRSTDIECVLKQFPCVYKQMTTGIGACLERKWTFTGFSTVV